MAKRPDGIRRYDGPAGGWDALKAVARALRQEETVAEGARALMRVNQPAGFDCPGCAWPDPKHTSAFEFCENGAKAVTWESTSKRASPALFEDHTVSELWEKSDHWLEDQGRLTTPLRYDAPSDRFRPIAWDEAFEVIGQTLKALPSPDAAEFYTSGRASNEAAFLYQLLGRVYGTNNFPDCSNMCHEATSVGLPESIGIGKGTVTLEDFDHCDMIIAIGHNPGTNHPRMMTTLRNASRRGVKIIVLNPLKERALERFEAPQAPVEMVTMTSTPIATAYHQVKVGGDVAALKGIMKALIAMDDDALQADLPRVLDAEFIAGHTAGFEELAAELRALAWTDVVEASGLQRQVLEEVATAYAGSKATIISYGMGVTQHRNGAANVQQIANLLLLRGNIGRTGAGICPLRGHSNVQGDRTVGISERPPKAFLDQLEAVFDFQPPRENGHSVVEALTAMAEGRSKVLISLGGNLAMAAPDQPTCFRAVRGLDLHVAIATKLNRTHLLIARDTLILPCLGRTEQDVQAEGPQAVTVEDSMSMVHASRGFMQPAAETLKSECAIVAGIAKATFGSQVVDWDWLVADYDRIRDKIEAVLPQLFQGYNARIRTPGGFRLPNSAGERIWSTPSGKANFLISPGVEPDAAFAAPGVFRMTTLRSHEQYNTTIYNLGDRYRGVFGRRDVLFMNPQDMAQIGMKEGDVVDVATAGALARRADGSPRVIQGLTLVDYPLPRGCCASYYPEANALISLDYVDASSKTPGYKSIPVEVRPTAGGATAASGIGVTRAGVVGGAAVHASAGQTAG